MFPVANPCMSLPCGSLGTCQRDSSVGRGYFCVCYPGVSDEDCDALNLGENGASLYPVGKIIVSHKITYDISILAK